MSETITRHIGETWQIDGLARFDTGAVLDLTDATVTFRMDMQGGDLESEAEILDATAGSYVISIPPAQTINIPKGRYPYEVRVSWSAGVVRVLNSGDFLVIPSLFIE